MHICMYLCIHLLQENNFLKEMVHVQEFTEESKHNDVHDLQRRQTLDHLKMEQKLKQSLNNILEVIA